MPEPIPDAAIPRPNVVGQVTETLRRGIVAGHFAPGQRLIEADLTRDLNVSRSALREALRRLAGEGVVEIVHNRGALVRRFSQTEVRDLFRVRAALEGLTARLAAENIGQGANRQRFAAVVRQSLRFAPGRPLDAYSQDNRLFHQTLIELAGNPYLGQLVRAQMPILRLQIRQAIDDGFWRRSYAEHRAIAKAVMAGRPDLAEEAMRRHLNEATERVMAFPADTFPPGSAAPASGGAAPEAAFLRRSGGR
jgi:DNA-binding GntR family transcriptional regulator